MKALLLSRYNHIELADFPIPKPASNEVLIRVAACGICGSDIHGYDGSSGRRIPPIVMGHEAAGTVADVGADVRNFAVQDRVTFDSTISCGTCWFCVRGQINLCNHREVLGVSCGDYCRAGAFAEYVLVPSHIVYKLPSAVSFTNAALLEAVSVAVHAVSLAEPAHGRPALIVGAGPIGLLCVQALRAAGCSRVFISDPDGSRLALAKQFGAACTLATGSEFNEQIRDLTNGEGVDLVIDAVGRVESVAASVDAVRKGGTIVLVGNIAPTVTLPLQKIVTCQISLQGSCASAGEYPRSIELMASGAIDVKPLITAVAPLEQGPYWFKRLHAGEAGLTKVILTPSSFA